MSFVRWLVVGVLQCCVLTCLYAKVKIDNVSDYNFGLIRPGYYPIKESAVNVLAANYTLTVYGQHDMNTSFHLVHGMYKVSYAISWNDGSGNWVTILPNTMSPIFKGAQADRALTLSTLQIQIKGNAPKPGHYSDTLTLIITPA